MNGEVKKRLPETESYNSEVDELAVKSLAKAIRKNHKDAEVKIHSIEEVKQNQKRFIPEVDSIIYHELADFGDMGYEPVFDYDVYNSFDSDGVPLYETGDDERVEFSDENRKFEVFPLPREYIEKYPFLAELPKNIAVMGGMARSIAREIVAGESEPIRDIDLVNILTPNQESLYSGEVLDELSQKYMADDYAFGHGIGSETLDGYFESRDFTVNEVLIMNGAVVMSNFAYDDLQENIIRPTYYQAPHLEDISDSRTAIRALTMLATLSESTKSCPTIEDMKIDRYYVRDFDAALGMNKVMSRGAEVANRYTNILVEYEILWPYYANRPKEAAESLGSACYPYGFYYHLNADERVGNEAHRGDHFNGPGGVDFYSSNPEIQAALEEYSDDVGSERYSGQYTQEEIDEINWRVAQLLEK